MFSAFTIFNINDKKLDTSYSNESLWPISNNEIQWFIYSHNKKIKQKISQPNFLYIKNRHLFILNDYHQLILDQQKVAIRTGHHCAQPLLKKLNLNSTARASFGIYNTRNDVDHFIEAIKETKIFFNNA